MKKYIKPATAIITIETMQIIATSSATIVDTTTGVDFTLGAPEDFDWCDDDDYGW